MEEKPRKKNYRKYVFFGLLFITFLFVSRLLTIAILIFYIWKYTDSKRGLKVVYTILAVFPLIYFLLLFLGLAPIRTYQISGNSMAPALVKSERLFATSLDKNIKRGDIVIHESPANDGKSIIRRVVGLPNETVGLTNGKVTINGRAIDESAYLGNTTTAPGKALKENGSIKLTNEQYFVMADKRSVVFDSRNHGPISKASVEGKFLFKY